MVKNPEFPSSSLTVASLSKVTVQVLSPVAEEVRQNNYCSRTGCQIKSKRNIETLRLKCVCQDTIYLQRSSWPTCHVLLWTSAAPMSPGGLHRCSLPVCHPRTLRSKTRTNKEARHWTSSSYAAKLLPTERSRKSAARPLNSAIKPFDFLMKSIDFSTKD